MQRASMWHLLAVTVSLTLAMMASGLEPAAAPAAGGGIAMCTPAECDCRLPSVRTEGRSFTKTVGAKMCICLCGSEINEDCKTDGQCVTGAYCKFEYSTADATFAAAGKCTSNCNRQVCPQFHECSVGKDGAAKCACSRYPCDNSVVVPICAASADDRAILRFNNTCLYVNENCDRKQRGQAELASFICMGS